VNVDQLARGLETSGREVNGFTFTDRPVPTTLPEYAAARSALVEYLSRRQDVVALYEYGSVSAPGLSDLDFIVVIADRPAPDVARYLDRAALPADAARIMARATLMVMSEREFPHVTRWDDLRLVLRCGRPVETVCLEGRALFLTEICRVIDWLPWQIARLTRVIAARQIPVVTTIGWLYSLTYSFRRLEMVFGESHDRWRVFQEQIVDLRRRYLTEPDSVETRLSVLVREGHFVACDAMREFAEHLTRDPSIYGPTSAPAIRLTVPGGTVLDFVSRRGVPSPSDLVSAAIGGTAIVHLPAVLGRHFTAYGVAGGVMGGALRMALTPSVSASETSHIATDMQEILRERMSVCNRWASFLIDNNIPSGLFKFAWFFGDDRSDRDVRSTSH
jgi:hypothetical protein